MSYRKSGNGKQKAGLVFNVQRYSIDDGPGIRTTVFLKGCPLKCLWCCNPESQNFLPEIAHREVICQKCGRCAEMCPSGAIAVEESGWKINRGLCNLCGRCVKVCIRGALNIIGKKLTPEEVMIEIERDMEYYKVSGGGVTLSGGEPLVQPRFARALFTLCVEKGIHTCLDTSGYGSTQALEDLMPVTNLVYFDLKHPDSKRHEELTGRDNLRILKNLEKISNKGVPVVVRFPLVPGINDDWEALDGIGRIMKGMGLRRLHVLPYHRLGVGKYKMLGRTYELEGINVPSSERLKEVKEFFEALGLLVEVRA